VSDTTERVTVPLGEELIAPLHPVYYGVPVDRTPGAPRLVPGRRVWLVTRYQDAKTVLANSNLAKDVRRATELYNQHTGNSRPVVGGAISKHLLNVDPPDHTRLRGMVAGIFREDRVHARRPAVTGIAEAVLDGLAGRDRIDLKTDYALPFSVANTCHLLGVPVADMQKLFTFAELLQRFVTPAEADEVCAGMAAMLRELIEKKRDDPGEDLLTQVLDAHSAGELSDDELVAMYYVLIVAGYETSVNLIANGILTLLLHPDQLAMVRADPALLPGAVEEILRYEGPAAMSTVRFTTAPIAVGDTVIPEGEFVLVSLSVANRDPARFADPDRFDIGRSAAGHLSFGHGAHHCVGAPMGRLEGEIAIGGFLRRFPEVALGVGPEEIVWLDGTMVRNLSALPVRLHGAAADTE
jgi:cytochrome P450